MNPTTLKAKSSLVVAGADIDVALATKQTAGDKVMVEVNGHRIYTSTDCPLTAESAWEVLSNNPPPPFVTPTEEHTLVLWHPIERHELVLHYMNLLMLDEGQPAVFREHDGKLATDGNANPQMTYIMLQMVSHGIQAKRLPTEFEPYYREDARSLLKMGDMRRLILDQWQGMLTAFDKKGWRQKSIKRLALRAFVTPSDIDLLIVGAGEKLSLAALLRIHEALHWLPYRITLATGTYRQEDREVVGERGHAANQSTDAKN